MTNEQGPLPIIEGRYTCVAVLGQGAMARTLKAIDEKTGEIVAVKVLYPSRLSSLKEFELFEREARTLARLSHRNIPTYIDHFDWTHKGERTYCLVQQHIDGKSLKQRLEDGERLEEGAVIDLGIEVLEVLQYLGSFDPPVVHRDIKPSNLVTGRDGRLHLVDFGAVREAVRQTLQCGSTVVGTYGYMPPEQLVGETRPASDIFALGVTLIHTLTRREAAQLSTDGFTIALDQLNLTLSEPFRKVLKGMIATRIEDRYASADQALDDLRAIKEGRAPRFVDKLERDIATRRKSEERKIQKRLSAGVTWVYRLLAALAVAAFGAAIYFIALQVAVDLVNGLGVAFGVSAVGLLVSFVMLARRYIDDGWMPPPVHWRKVSGEVVSEPFLDSSHWARYSFRAPRTNDRRRLAAEDDESAWIEVKGAIAGSPDEIKKRYPVGTKITVHYDPAQPHNHHVEVDRS